MGRVAAIAHTTTTWLVVAAAAATLAWSAVTDGAPGSGEAPQRDPYTRFIARADAIVMGKVVDAGTRDVPVPGAGDSVATTQGFARMAVLRWIVGPDTDDTLEVRLNPGNFLYHRLRSEAPQSDRCVILYLTRWRGRLLPMREVVLHPDRPGLPLEGIEVLSVRAAQERIPAILREAAATSLDSLAARADLAVVASLDYNQDTPPSMNCRVERLVAGTLSDSFITVVQGTPGDLRRDRALLLLRARADHRWEVLEDNAGCYYLYRERIGRSPAALDSLCARIADAHARRLRSPLR